MAETPSTSESDTPHLPETPHSDLDLINDAPSSDGALVVEVAPWSSRSLPCVAALVCLGVLLLSLTAFVRSGYSYRFVVHDATWETQLAALQGRTSALQAQLGILQAHATQVLALVTEGSGKDDNGKDDNSGKDDNENGKDDNGGDKSDAAIIDPSEVRAAPTKIMQLLHAPPVRHIWQHLPALTDHGFTNDHRLCRSTRFAEPLEKVLGQRIAMLVITYKTPKSLENTLQSYERVGIFDLFDERLLFVGGPNPDAEIRIGQRYNMTIITPDNVAFSSVYHIRSKDRHEWIQRTDLPIRLLKHGHNSMVAGKAIASALRQCSADYVLMLEKDFMLPVGMTLDKFKQQFFGALYMTAVRGIPIVRLRSRQDAGTAGFIDCIKKQCKWKMMGDVHQRQMNWFTAYQETIQNPTSIAECADGPVRMRCFTSDDSNFSNNPYIMSMKWFDKQFFAHRWRTELRNHTARRVFEFGDPKSSGDLEMWFINVRWNQYHVPICISYDGIFRHVEIDG